MGSSVRLDGEGAERGRSRPQNGQERQDRIAAYVDGEMTSDEAAAFERRMETDEALRRDVEQWREAIEAARHWMAADAPGVERVAALKVPSVAGRRSSAARPARVLTIRSVAWRGIAAAAIFVAGLYVGQMTQRAATAPDRDGTKIRPAQHVTRPEKTQPTQGESTRPEKVEGKIAGLSAQHYTRDENGRLVIETTLKGSGAQALWVVDGGFQLAQFPAKP